MLFPSIDKDVVVITVELDSCVVLVRPRSHLLSGEDTAAVRPLN